MDSVTQIVLGAAVGEVVLGKKLGNKAMLWGAIAGTIPDLDVYQSLFFDKLRANELHRGFSHSILFSIIFAPILAWFVSKREKWTLSVLTTLIFAYPLIANDSLVVRLVLGGIILLLNGIIWLHDFSVLTATKGDWTKLMFWSLITHPLLDCHTTWGTQLLWPLPYKLAWNNIFVLDPMYTVPFLVCVTVALFFHRTNRLRGVFNWLGIALSSSYMLWSLGVKWYTHEVFSTSLQNQNIEYSRITTVPTPMNTFLWSATADADSVYYVGLYSIFDKDKNVQFDRVETNHYLLDSLQDEETLNRLYFLSKNWYVVREVDGALVFNDARYGPMYKEDHQPLYGFGYRLEEKEGKLKVSQPEPDRSEMKPIFVRLWTRIWGK